MNQAAFFIQPTPALAARLNAVTQQAADRISRRIETWLHGALEYGLRVTLNPAEFSVESNDLFDLVQRNGFKLKRCADRIELHHGRRKVAQTRLYRPCHGDAN